MASYDDITKAILSGRPKKAYLLYGDEPLFIDRLTALFLERLLPEEAKAFDQVVLYGEEMDAKSIATEALGYPMIGDRKLVVVREAQMIRNLEKIIPYIEQLPESTCLVLAYKKKLEKTKSLIKGFATVGELYESKLISERELPAFIVEGFAGVGLNIAPQTATLMAEATGNDLEKIMLEIQKLAIALPQGGQVTPKEIEEYVGISRDYNVFELKSALASRDRARAIKIALYFSHNEKRFSVQSILPILFGYFAQLMAVYYLPSDISDRDLASAIRVSPYAVMEYRQGRALYSSKGVFDIIRQIRLADAASKGVGSSSSGGSILLDLINFILSV